MNPKELSNVDDIATALILDPYLGFTSHKMNLAFEPPDVHHLALKKIMEDFISDQNYEKVLKLLMNGGWMPHNTLKLQSKILEEHVCKHNYFLCINYFAKKNKTISNNN